MRGTARGATASHWHDFSFMAELDLTAEDLEFISNRTAIQFWGPTTERAPSGRGKGPIGLVDTEEAVLRVA